MADPPYVNVDDFTEFIQSNFRNEESTTTSVTGTKTKGDAVIQYLKGVCGQEQLPHMTSYTEVLRSNPGPGSSALGQGVYPHFT